MLYILLPTIRFPLPFNCPFLSIIKWIIPVIITTTTTQNWNWNWSNAWAVSWALFLFIYFIHWICYFRMNFKFRFCKMLYWTEIDQRLENYIILQQCVVFNTRHAFPRKRWHPYSYVSLSIVLKSLTLKYETHSNPLSHRMFPKTLCFHCTLFVHQLQLKLIYIKNIQSLNLIHSSQNTYEHKSYVITSWTATTPELAIYLLISH